MSSSAQSPYSKKPIRLLVIQLARLGDTLQSLMALRAAKQLYPQLEIHFVARERFADAAKRVPWLSEVITLPTDALLKPVMSGQREEKQALGDVARWVAPLIKQPWDIAVNWSFSEASSYLTGLVPARVKLGYSRRKDASFYSPDGWSHYIQGVVQGRIEQNIHLTDILTTQLLTALQIHVGDPSTEEQNATVTSKGFFKLEVSARELGLSWRDSSKKWIGIQLGTAHPSKTWAPEKWAKFAAFVMNRHPECAIVLLGGKSEEGLARIFLEALKPQIRDMKNIVSLVGKSEFDLWASVISRCQWLIAGDTAALHLASVLGTRVLNVSVGPVRMSETGPYGNAHYVVTAGPSCAGCEQRDRGGLHSCHADVTPEAVYASWAYASSEWAHRRQMSLESHFAQLGWATELAAVRVYRSKIRNSEEGGGVVYEPVIQRALRVQDWTSQVMGHIARAWYCGWVPPVGQELIRGTINPTLVQALRQLDESTEVLIKVCEEAKRTAQSMYRKSSKMKSVKIMGLGDRQELQNLGKQMMELEKLVDRLASAQSPLMAFSQMSKVQMHNLNGENLADLGRQTADAYQQLSQGAQIFKEWVKHTLELAKPVAIGATVIPLQKEPQA